MMTFGLETGMPALRKIYAIVAVGLCLSVHTPAWAQGAVAFTGIQQDTSLPVEVTSDSLSVDQGNGAATFTGNVVIKQGEMTITSDTARVEYGKDNSQIERLILNGNVVFATPSEKAESADALYTVATGVVEMTGNVLLTQGPNTINGQTLVYNLDKGTGTMEGRVTTVFTPNGNAP